MSRLVAAGRIVEIQESLAEQVLGTQVREDLMTEQAELWNEFFPGRPYEQIRADAWMHKHVLKWESPLVPEAKAPFRPVVLH